MNLIDEELTREQFAFLGPEIVQRLLAATHRDLDSWGDRLMTGWDTGDQESIRVARHSIRGVCSNFGATRLHEFAQTDMTSAASREAFRALHDATLEAIRRTASLTVQSAT